MPGDTRFALFFPERRPFFLDGSEYFDAPNNLMYTRRIVQPDAAAKLTGRVGRTTLAWMPVASATRPKRLRERTSQAPATTSAVTASGTGMPASVPWPRKRKASGTPAGGR